MGRLAHSTEAAIAWRLDLGQSAAEVAAACGVSAQTVRKRERQSGESLEFPPWIAGHVRAIQAGWDDQTEIDRRAQQPDWPELIEVHDPRGCDSIMVSSECHISRHYRKDNEERTSR